MITADEAQSGLLPDNTEELSSESSSDSETAEREETSTVDTLLTHRRNQRLSVNDTTTASAAAAVKQTTERWQGSMLTRAKSKQANQQRARTVLLGESASKHLTSNSKKRQGEEKTKQTVGARTRVTPVSSKQSSQRRRDLAIEEGASSTRRVVTLDEAPPLPVSQTPAAVSSHNTAVSESDNRCLQVSDVIL